MKADLAAASAQAPALCSDVILFAIPADPNKRLPFEWLPAYTRAFGDDKFTDGVAWFVRLYRWMETQLRDEREDRAELMRLLRESRSTVLEEAAQAAAAVGPVMCESYGDGAECIRTADACAAAIRSLKPKVSNGR